MPVEVKGIVEAQKALKKFAPDLYKEMNKEIRAAMRVVVDDARSKVPNQIDGLSGWQDQGKEVVSRTAGKVRGFPKYNPDIIRKGLTYSLGRSRRNYSGFVNTYRLLNRSAAGAIYETAGRKNPQGRTPIASVNQQGFEYLQGYEGTYKYKDKIRKRATRNYNSNNPFAGYQFVTAINDEAKLESIGRGRKNQGRLLFAAFAKDQGKVTKATFKAIETATTKFNSSLKRRIGLAA
jgi:hypothetical protein